MTKTKILFSILATFILSTGSVFAMTGDQTTYVMDYNDQTYRTLHLTDIIGKQLPVYVSGNTITYSASAINGTYDEDLLQDGIGFNVTSPLTFTFVDFDADGNYTLYGTSGTFNPNTNDDYTLQEIRLSQFYHGEWTVTIYPVGYNKQVATALFSFVDRNVSNNTGTGLSGNLIPSVSNLWPIVMIILGIIITFYVLDQIIKMFKKAMKEKGIKPHNDYGGKVTYDDHANVKFIEFDKKK